MPDDVLTGPVRRPHNRYAELPGSIHNDAVASKLGFRGGTVAGSVHMDQFVPLLVGVFGTRWFETGGLSLYFRSATTDGDPVRAEVRRPGRDGDGDGAQVAVRMTEPDGTLVADGTASAGNPGAPSAVLGRDLRPADPGALRILARLRPGQSLGTLRLAPDRDRQLDVLDRNQMTEPLPWYRSGSPWGGPVAAPSTVVGLLYAEILTPVKESLGPRVGLFGAIDLRFTGGPVLLDQTYDVSGEIVALSETPKTEVLWFDSWAEAGGRRVATMRMMLRSMKAASPLYPELAAAG